MGDCAYLCVCKVNVSSVYVWAGVRMCVCVCVRDCVRVGTSVYEREWGAYVRLCGDNCVCVGVGVSVCVRKCVRVETSVYVWAGVRMCV